MSQTPMRPATKPQVSTQSGKDTSAHPHMGMRMGTSLCRQGEGECEGRGYYLQRIELKERNTFLRLTVTRWQQLATPATTTMMHCTGRPDSCPRNIPSPPSVSIYPWAYLQRPWGISACRVRV